MAKTPKRGIQSDGESGNLPTIIKKYPNRRLYNTSTSAYIVQKDIEALVRDGVDFRIDDAKTGEDITRSILNQIIFEQETRPTDFHFPLEFQKQLIGMYGDGYSNMVPNYLTESLKFFATEREKAAEKMGTTVSRNTQAMMDYTQALAKQNMEIFRRSWDMFGMMAGVSPSSSEDQTDDNSQLSREDELEEKVIQLIQAAPDRQTAFSMYENLKSPSTIDAYEAAWPQDTNQE